MAAMALLVRDLVFFLGVALVVILVMRWLALPYTLGLVVVGLAIGLTGITPEARLSPELVLFVFLPALLFEGAWTSRFSLLRDNRRMIFFLAGPGLLLSLGIIALMLHWFEHLDWITALLLAAILSPTDPVAVLALFRQIHVNETLSSVIKGESLFNDGVAGSLYQTFLALVLVSTRAAAARGWTVLTNGFGLFLLEAGGGIALGLLSGWLISRALKRVDDPVLETAITLVSAYGVYWLADTMQFSGIMAVIVAGLMLGNYGRRIGMSEQTRSDVDTFWRMLAFLANALIFLLIGVQLHPFAYLLFTGSGLTIWIITLTAIGVVLLSRLVLVLAMRLWLKLPGSRGRPAGQPLPRSWQLIIFWSGLRGALSLALVLALPVSVPARDIMVISTYAVVLFTLLVQGFSIRWVLGRIMSREGSGSDDRETVLEEEVPQEAL